MNPKARLDQNLMRILYLRYKAYLVPIGVVVLSCIVFLAVVLPQYQNYFANKDTVAADQKTIQILNDNITTMQLLNQETIAKNLATATAALPSDKDYTGILNAISQAASSANVNLGDYSFQIGNVFGKTAGAASGQLTIDITLAISGDLSNAQEFIQALSKELPLSEVVGISTQGGSGSQISATFFYNPLPPITFNPSVPISSLSPVQQKLMQQLATDFKKPQDLAIPKKLVATPSAQTQ